MTTLDRETIYTAIFARAQQIAEFKTASRRVRAWTDVPPLEQPALFLGQDTEEPKQRRGLPTIWVLNPILYLYAYAPVPSQSAAPALNRLLDAFDRAFSPHGPETVQTLGGLVSHCWLAKVKQDEGVLGEQSLALVTLDVLVGQP